MILLSKNNTATPDPYTDGSGTNPVTAEFTFDGSGTPVEIVASTSEPMYIWANDDTGLIDNYSSITFELIGGDAGMVWEISDDNINWTNVLVLGGLDVSTSFQTISVYARVTAANDGSFGTDNYVAAKILLTAIQNPI